VLEVLEVLEAEADEEVTAPLFWSSSASVAMMSCNKPPPDVPKIEDVCADCVLLLESVLEVFWVLKREVGFASCVAQDESVMLPIDMIAP
jgi:hypothetical protein